ncbi:hypothetical protein HUU53_00830 [Candidatus Micrarchaeota archaeon]|nr:hypothetical protein [Candidatus Micrarchaeota archaeon]
MDFVKQLTEVLRHSVKWTKQPFTTLYYTAVAAAVIGLLFLVAGIIMLVLGLIGFAVPQLANEIKTTIIGLALASIGLTGFLLFIFIGSILLSGANALIYSDGLKKQNLKVRELKIIDFVKFFLLNIYIAIAAIFSIYWPQPLFVLFGTGILTYLGFISGGWLLGTIPLFFFVISAGFYLLNIIYQQTRLMLTPFYFLTKTNSITTAASMSYLKTNHRAISLLALTILSSLIISLTIQIAVGVIQFPFNIISAYLPIVNVITLLIWAAGSIVSMFAVNFALTKIFYLTEKDLI